MEIKVKFLSKIYLLKIFLRILFPAFLASNSFYAARVFFVNSQIHIFWAKSGFMNDRFLDEKIIPATLLAFSKFHNLKNPQA